MMCITYYFISLIVAVTNGVLMTNHSITNGMPSGRDSGEFKLTKLLNIEIGGEPEKVMDTDLRNTLLSEIKRGITNHLGSSTESQESVYTPLKSYSQKELITVLKELYSEVSSLKKNVSDTSYYSESGCLIQSDILDGKSYPVGVSFHRICHPNALKMEDTRTRKYFPTSCKDIQEQGTNVSGVYQIQPKKSEKPFMVLCDMETKGGGWTHIQKRYDGSVDFFLSWREYKFGFGDLQSEFWIGLENMYKMTGFERSELLVEIVDRENVKVYAHYKEFRIGSESEGYPLSTLTGYSGDAGDPLTHHVGCKFSTKDLDQDNHSGNCAVMYSGAWWYKACHLSNLNGRFLNLALPAAYKGQGMDWTGLRESGYSYSKSRMMVRPAEG